MGKKASTITLSTDDRLYLEAKTSARTIQAQTINRARILLLKADGISIDNIADKVGMNHKNKHTQCLYLFIVIHARHRLAQQFRRTRYADTMV